MTTSGSMKKRRLRTSLGLFLLAVLSVVYATGAEGQERQLELRGNLTLEEARAFSGYSIYYAGEDLGNLPLTAGLRRHGQGEPGNRVTPNFVSFIYGSCHPRPGMGCTPPIEIQVWPACERNPAVYDWTPEERARIDYTTVRGAPAVVYEDGRRLEISTGRSTIVIFGPSKEAAFSVASKLRSLNAPVARGDALPPAAAGVLEGRLGC
jgi:hypothetical protein